VLPSIEKSTVISQQIGERRARSPDHPTSTRGDGTMTERKPPGVSWEGWIDRQIREAAERGEFDDLSGAGKPIPGLDQPDEMWWIKRKLQSEGLTYEPPSLALRKDAHDALEAALQAGSEGDLRQIVEGINQRIRESNRRGIAGPSLPIVPFDVERVVKRWREQNRQGAQQAALGASSRGGEEPHHQRRAAESFGSDPERYDQARPRYPDALIRRIVAGIPDARVLDVGVGTGIVARQFQAAGCQVLGVDPDGRLAEFARHSGVEVEVSSFEAWDAASRKFDVVVSGESWHWVDPLAGAAKAAEVLRPGGRLAVFWNTGQPPERLEEAFAEVYRRCLPESLVARLERTAIQAAHAAMRARTAEGIEATGAFDDPEQWRFEWTRSYTRDEWLDALRTTGDAVPQTQLPDLLEGIGNAIEAAGGSFTLDYVTFVVTAVRRS
jgi:SAM-dependent methyltransferase